MSEQSEFEKWYSENYHILPWMIRQEQTWSAWQACAERKDERIAKLTEKLFALGAMDEAPCFHCGYSGERYFNPDKHPCAARHYGETE